MTRAAEIGHERETETVCCKILGVARTAEAGKIMAAQAIDTTIRLIILYDIMTVFILLHVLGDRTTYA